MTIIVTWILLTISHAALIIAPSFSFGSFIRSLHRSHLVVARALVVGWCLFISCVLWAALMIMSSVYVCVCVCKTQRDQRNWTEVHANIETWKRTKWEFGEGTIKRMTLFDDVRVNVRDASAVQLFYTHLIISFNIYWLSTLSLTGREKLHTVDTECRIFLSSVRFIEESFYLFSFLVVCDIFKRINRKRKILILTQLRYEKSMCKVWKSQKQINENARNKKWKK